MPKALTAPLKDPIYGKRLLIKKQTYYASRKHISCNTKLPLSTIYSPTLDGAYMGQKKTIPFLCCTEIVFPNRYFPVTTYKQTLQIVSKAEIGLITWSDHSPVTLTHSPAHSNSTKQNGKCSTIWRMNTPLLLQPKCQEEIKRELEHYFAHTVNSLSKNVLLWNLHIALMREILLRLGAHEKRKQVEEYNKVSWSDTTAWKFEKTSPNNTYTACLQNLREELRTFLQTTFDHYIKESTGTYWEIDQVLF